MENLYLDAGIMLKCVWVVECVVCRLVPLAQDITLVSCVHEHCDELAWIIS